MNFNQCYKGVIRNMNQKIRVCHITSAHPSYDVRIFQKECRTLAEDKRFEVFLVAQGKSRKEDGIKVVGVGENTKGRLQRIINTSNKVYRKALCLNADIYHLHDPELLLYAIKLKKLGKIVIFDSHENYPEQIREKNYLPVWFRKTIAFVYKNFETFVLKRIDAVVVPGLANNKNIFEGRCKKTVFIDNFPLIDERRKYKEHTFSKGQEVFKVCYVGSLSSKRGITQLIKACYNANARLILAGNFSSEEYKNKIFGMKEISCVEYRGFCDFDVITDIYNESHLGAATLLKVGQYATMNNLPTKTYEYMQAGLPIIMTDNKYNIELMKKENFAYLVDSNNDIAISELIKHISENYSETYKKARLAYELAHKKYNWNLEGKKLIQLYDYLLKKYRE